MSRYRMRTYKSSSDTKGIKMYNYDWWKFDKDLMYQVYSSESLQKALRYIINNYFEISSKSRDFVIKNFSLEKMIGKTLEVYEL